jgi:hypothetical protein
MAGVPNAAEFLDLALLPTTKVREHEAAGGQLTAYLTALFKAVESSPSAAVV